MNLPQQRERVTIDGLGNIGVGKYKNTAKTVAKSGESGIIKLKSDAKNTSIPKSYSERGIEIPDRLKQYLNNLNEDVEFIEVNKGDISMRDISALSRETGVEFACVTIDKKSYLIKSYYRD